MEMTDHVYRVIIGDDALSRLNVYVSFLSQANRSAAHVLRNDLLARIGNLGKTPFLYPVFNSKTLSDMFGVEYRKLTYKRYLILYTVDESAKTVYVEYIWDTRMDNSL